MIGSSNTLMPALPKNKQQFAVPVKPAPVSQLRYHSMEHRLRRQESESRIQEDFPVIAGMLEYWNDGMLGPMQQEKYPESVLFCHYANIPSV